MSSRNRHGVTAIELLVVIAIIGIILSLIFGAVMAVRSTDMGATTQLEIREMTIGLEYFKTKYGMYPPSKVTLSATSIADPVLQRIWPNLSPTAMSSWPGFSWTVTLTGDQCLVFFLGGRHDASGCYGFSKSKSNPFEFNAGEEREAPLFKFKIQRMYQRDTSKPFYSYGDGFFKVALNGVEQKPTYAYFAPTKGGTYSETDGGGPPDGKPSSPNSPKPYKDAANAYLNRQSFQLMSSGKNLLWGTARQWGSGINIADPDSVDNITNFSNGILTGN